MSMLPVRIYFLLFDFPMTQISHKNAPFNSCNIIISFAGKRKLVFCMKIVS